MITNKDIRVENGSLIINGDQYPLDGQSPEAIMQIVEDNSDTTPTENSNNPVKSGGIKTYVDNAIQYFDTGLSANTVGHEAPKWSASGVYYEPLVTFAALNITKDKVLNIIPVGWNYITRPFVLYMSGDGSHVGAIIDSNTSIYAANGNLTIRVVYKN